MKHRALDELQAGLAGVQESPADGGTLQMIVRRPEVGVREVLDAGKLDVVDGLVGDNWRARGSKRTADGSAHPDMQVTVMNARLATLIAGEKDRWSLAGDQLFVDLDLSVDNLDVGARIAIGKAVIEVTAQPHTGCKKFATRYGMDAVRFVNSEVGRRLRLRGLNAKVIRSGRIQVGDIVSIVGDRSTNEAE